VKKRILVAVILVVLLAASTYAQTNFFELVKTGTPEDIQTAISRGAKVNATKDGWTPLMLAAAYNQNPEAITTLLKAGADVKAKGHALTPLQQAAIHNQNPEVITTLLKAGADVKAQSKDGWTALMYAAQYSQNPEVITVLLKAGTDVKAQSKDGWTALMLAARYGQSSEVITTLLKVGADVKAQNKDGSTPLIYAAQYSPNPEVITTLLKAGADLEARATDGSTPLMLAAQYNQNPEVITVLLKAGADVKAQNKDGSTALIYAAQYSPNPEVITTLLKAGADVKAQSKDGWTALMLAAQYSQNPEVITVLLKAGADVKAQNTDGWTPLMLAARYNQNPDMITALLKAGADLKAEDKDGDTPLMLAAQYNQNPEVITALLKAGAELEFARDKDGETPLMLAAQYNQNPDMITALLKAGADLKAADKDGETPLMLAAQYSPNPEVIMRLLTAGANAYALDSAGKTAVDYAQGNEKLKGSDAYRQVQQKPSASLELKDLSFEDIYPVFHTYYDTHSLGRVVLCNTTKQPITGIKVSFQIKEFMADPNACPAPSELGPGELKSVDLFGLFLPTILQTTEKTKTQARVDVECTLGGHVEHQNLVQSIPILNRNATSWVDDKRAAAFVTVRDPVVLTFSRNVNSMVKGTIKGEVNPNLITAVAFFQALQLYGLTYSQDPIPTLTANSQVADFIQFPRETLQYKGGKCSDFSVLYCALLESVGIETAFITIPGHIFIAFSTGVSPDEARKSFFSRADDLIVQNDKSWIPVEVTETAGFLQAWQDGAKEWRENTASNQAAFYPLHDAWQLYEPVALPGTEVAVNLPPSEKIVSASKQEVGKFIDKEISTKAAALESQITNAQDSRKPTNELGVLFARYGQYDRAQKEFEKLLAKEEYVPALLNMGNIFYLNDQKEKALVYYNRAYAKDPENPRVLLQVARVNHDLENYGAVEKLYAELKARDPDLARRFAYLDLKGEDATRAANVAGVNGAVVWEE
jgi:ankyrin repeat protein/tetratricopeptide (TPR) repeat protein